MWYTIPASSQDNFVHCIEFMAKIEEQKYVVSTKLEFQLCKKTNKSVLDIIKLWSLNCRMHTVVDILAIIGGLQPRTAPSSASDGPTMKLHR